MVGAHWVQLEWNKDPLSIEKGVWFALKPHFSLESCQQHSYLIHLPICIYER